MNEKLLGTLFWVHGTETEEEYRQAFEAATDNGIGEITIESRPHIDYLGDKWWSDLEMILGWCREKNISAYIFDEKWFPSGVAGGKIQNLKKEYRNLALRFESITYTGPQSGVSVMPPWSDGESSFIVSAFAYRMNGRVPDYNSVIELNDRLTGLFSLHNLGIINSMEVDIPQGTWRIVFAVAFYSDNYINPFNQNAVSAFIDSTYEETKKHLGRFFGNTVKGFFFDEPGYFTRDFCIPWNFDFPELFEKEKGYSLLPRLYALWRDDAPDAFRYDFYDFLNRRYAVTYNKSVYEWCRKNGVRLIGHWFEHESSNFLGERTMLHSDLKVGCGNFFEVSRYADEGGVDLVCNQVIPGKHNRDYYGLPKLGSSAAHIYNMKDDLAFSETFGAYGYHLGLPMMKWLIDWQAVRGINHFIMHAFNPKKNDTDCPPYYYDDGINPQWKYFGRYSDYTNRLSELFRGGRHVAQVMLMFPGSAVYAGLSTPIEDAERLLCELQYDYDIVPETVTPSVDAQRRCVSLEKETYGAVMVCGTEVVSAASTTFLTQCAKSGVPVIFLHRTPVLEAGKGSDMSSFGARLDKILSSPFTHVLRDHTQLESVLCDDSVAPCISYSGTNRENLRALHRVDRAGRDIFLLTNESTDTACRGTLELDGMVCYSALDDVYFEPQRNGDGILLYLEPYSSVVLMQKQSEMEISAVPAEYLDTISKNTQLILSESVALALDGTICMGLHDWLEISPEFSGSGVYTFETTVRPDTGRIILDLGEVSDISEVRVNSVFCGERICFPHRYDITEALRPGKNRFEITVTNCVSNRMHALRENTQDCILCSGGIKGNIKIFSK